MNFLRAEKRGYRGFSKSSWLKDNEKDMDVIKKIGNSMKTGSLCGHGQLGYNPVSSAVKYFKDEFDNALSANHPIDDKEVDTMILPTRTRP